MAAVKNGKSIDTTMGFTPLEGLLMGTRSGDIDPSVILYIMGKEGLALNEASTLLNKHGGLVGISGESSDMREILTAAKENNKRAIYAFEVFCYRIKKYLGAYAAAMGGLDAFVFTGGMGRIHPKFEKNRLPVWNSSVWSLMKKRIKIMTKRFPKIHQKLKFYASLQMKSF